MSRFLGTVQQIDIIVRGLVYFMVSTEDIIFDFFNLKSFLKWNEKISDSKSKFSIMQKLYNSKILTTHSSHIERVTSLYNNHRHHHHHHQDLPIARIPLIVSYHPSLSAIGLSKSSTQHVLVSLVGPKINSNYVTVIKAWILLFSLPLP